MNTISVNFEPVELDTNIENEEIKAFYKASMEVLQMKEPIQLQQGTPSLVGEVGSHQSSEQTVMETPFLDEDEDYRLQEDLDDSWGFSKASSSPVTLINKHEDNSTHLNVGFSFGIALGVGVAQIFLEVSSFTDAYTYTQCFSLIDVFNYVKESPILMEKMNIFIDAFMNSSGANAPTLIGMYFFGKKLIKK